MMQDLFYKYNTEKSIPDDLQALAAIIQLWSKTNLRCWKEVIYYLVLLVSSSYDKAVRVRRWQWNWRQGISAFLFLNPKIVQ
jgi:hypothetical protein